MTKFNFFVKGDFLISTKNISPKNVYKNYSVSIPSSAFYSCEDCRHLKLNFIENEHCQGKNQH